MKKTFTLSLALAMAATMGAETVKVLSSGPGIPGSEYTPQLEGLGISPNGRYVCGSIESGIGMFVADAETGELLYVTTEDPEGAQLRNVDNNGLAIGFDGPGVTFSLQGVRTVLNTPEGYRYVLGEDITADGSIMVGSICEQSFETHAAYCKGDGTWLFLPHPDKEVTGGFDRDDSSAKFVSGDGKVILGYLGSFGIATAWIMNEAGEYDADPFFTKVVAMSKDEVESEKPLVGLTPCGVSDNGKYILCYGDMPSGDEARMVPVVYNTEEKSFKIYDEIQEIDEYYMGLTPVSIANDGTFIGVVGMPLWGSTGTFIMYAGEDQAKLWINEFPAYAEIFAESDMMGFNVPTDMSADGRYIIGYAFYCEDFDDEEALAYELTYIIDTERGSAVTELPQAAGEQAIYSLDGQKLREMTKGINIVKGADGKVRKVIKK